MGTKSRETISGASVCAAAERAAEARKDADRLAVAAWNKRMLSFRVRRSHRLRSVTRSMPDTAISKSNASAATRTRPLDIVRRPKATPVHELERYMRCRQCSEVRGYPYKRSHLVALRATKITADSPPSTWWPGER